MTYRLRNSDIENPEIQANFEDIEGQLSLFKTDDSIVATEVKGTKAKKIALKDSTGKILGFIPLYAE